MSLRLRYGCSLSLSTNTSLYRKSPRCPDSIVRQKHDLLFVSPGSALNVVRLPWATSRNLYVWSSEASLMSSSSEKEAPNTSLLELRGKSSSERVDFIIYYNMLSRESVPIFMTGRSVVPPKIIGTRKCPPQKTITTSYGSVICQPFSVHRPSKKKLVIFVIWTRDQNLACNRRLTTSPTRHLCQRP